VYFGVAPMGTCDSNTTSPTCVRQRRHILSDIVVSLSHCETKLLRHDAVDVWMEQSQQSAYGCLTNLQQLI